MRYRSLFPPVLTGLLILSVFSTAKNNMEVSKQYDDYISQAREAASYEIYVDAEADYIAALGIEKSLEIYNELAEVYVADNKENEAKDVCVDMINAYPYEGYAYTLSAQIYMQYEDYEDIYDLYNRYKKKELNDEGIEKIYSEIKWLYEIGNQYGLVSSYSNGLCAVTAEEGDVWGYVDTSGKKTIDYTYKQAGVFIGDIAPVQTEDGSWYFIDTDGNKKKVLNKIKNVKDIGYVCDAIPVYNGEAWAYYTDSQKLICEGYDEAMAMANGYAAVRVGEDWFLIDSNGEKASEYTYSDIVVDDKGIAYRNCYFAEFDGKYYLYDKDGAKIGSGEYQDAKIFNAGEKYAAVEIDGKWGFIDSSGAVVIEPEYEDAHSFLNGVAAVKIDDRWGFIDEDNNLVIENKFTDVKDFNEDGNVMVEDCGTWQMLKLLRYED
jgi:hypothetical protein